MLTSQQWWDKVKGDRSLLMDWLADQYHGETTAHTRIMKFVADFAKDNNSEWISTLNTIAEQELQH